MKKQKHINEFINYVLSKEKESFLDNPLQTNRSKSRVLSAATKKLDELSERYLNEVKK